MPTGSISSLVPLLVVRDAAAAIDFYGRALGARELVRFANGPKGTISHADLAIGEAVFSLTEEAPAWNSDSPPSLGGSPVVLQLRVEDVDVVFERMRAAGATAIFPITEFCGERMARLRDPYGHLWLIWRQVEGLPSDEIRRRRDAWNSAGQAPKS